MASLSQDFLDPVNDIDTGTSLACHEGFLLGPWLQRAKQLAHNEEEEKQGSIQVHSTNCMLTNLKLLQYEWNAKTEITRHLGWKDKRNIYGKDVETFLS